MERVLRCSEMSARLVTRVIWALFSSILIAGLIALLTAGCGKEPERPTNVLLLVVDTLRADRLGCYGYPRATSPNIDALAARGTLYEKNYTQACWTVPSMISMLAGVSVTQEESVCPTEIPLLSEVLAKQGLETIGFPANAVLCNKRGFERGFETWSEAPNVDAVELARRFSLWHGARSHVAGKARPWFAWLQFIDPHQPYEPRPEHDLFHGPRPDQERVSARWKAAQGEATERSQNLSGRNLDDAIDWMTQKSNLYDGEVRASDDGVGRVLETLKAAGELENTLVILVADHGEMIYEHRVQPYLIKDRIDRTGGLPDGVADLFGNGHRPWYFENLWNTPMILAGPGIPAGKRVDSLCANLDVYPTVLEALDLPRTKWLEGESLFGGATTVRDKVLAHAYFTSAVREKAGLKLIEYWPRLFLLEETADKPKALYDLGKDPFEDVEISAQRPEQVSRLHDEIEAWKKRAERSAITTNTDAQHKVMEQMGYVDGK